MFLQHDRLGREGAGGGTCKFECRKYSFFGGRLVVLVFIVKYLLYLFENIFLITPKTGETLVQRSV